MPDLIASLLGGGVDAGSWDGAFDAALLRARACDGLGGAFLAGYQGALRALVPSLGTGARAALCATEAGGAHPRHIATRLEGGAVTGEKRWVTGGRGATALLVLCVLDEDTLGRKDLRLVWVDPSGPGVFFEDMPPTPFAPEVSHAVVRFERAPARAVLDGAGWEDLVKPFRALEDAYVVGAAMAYVVGWGLREGAPASLVSAALASVAALRGIAAMDPRSWATHLALDGALAQSGGVFAAVDAWCEGIAGEARDRWLRDRALLAVASRARALRAERAWAVLQSRRNAAMEESTGAAE